MRLDASRLRLSASDLARHLGCRHLTALDLQVAQGRLKPPRPDPALDALQQRGFEHEAQYLAHLRGLGVQLAEIKGDSDASALEATVAAMRTGTDVIVQATLVDGDWHGRADVLRRVPIDSALGDWSYEVVDTKLARETRAGTILQLCLYSDIVGAIQQRLPDSMYVVSPGRGFEPETFRVHDYLAYYRLVRAQLASAVNVSGQDEPSTYPNPVPQCDVCRWWPACDRRRREDDHLSLVAGISTLQRREPATWPVNTLADLADVPLPLERKPRRGSVEGLERVREQARVQRQGRTERQPVYELLPREPDRGVARLPEPSPDDIFFDIEGDPFVGTGGLEYLLGWAIVTSDGTIEYRSHWACSPREERRAFEAFVDEAMDAWSRDPSMHIYHFAPYEPSAVKRLMGRYATREEQVDRLLRAEVFVDLHAVVKQSLRASVERYSIKDLEAFYGYTREVDLRNASKHLRGFERALELGLMDDVPQDVRATVEASESSNRWLQPPAELWMVLIRRADDTDRGEPLFPRWSNVRRGLRVACKRAGIDPVSPNDYADLFVMPTIAETRPVRGVSEVAVSA